MSNAELNCVGESSLLPAVVAASGRAVAAPIFAVKQLQGVKALTDRGRGVPLFQFEPLTSATSGSVSNSLSESERRKVLESGEQIFLTNTRHKAAQAQRILEPRVECNCHGWIFAGGRFGIYGLHVSMILEDNGYAPVKEPQDGDVAIYFDHGMAGHSGLVRHANGNGPLLIESKWGPFGVFLHAPDAHPFSGVCTFYRSGRSGHGTVIKHDVA